LKRQLELPSSGWLRKYRVRVQGRVKPERLAALAKGITVDGVDYGPVEASLDRQSGTNAWLTVGLREGKNREVRKICVHLGLAVNRLIRIAYGPFSLGKLPKRALAEVEPTRLRQALGLEDKTKKARGKGFAKPKPKLNRPGSKRGFKHQRDAAADKAAGKAPAARTLAAKKPAAKKPASKKVVARKSAARTPGAQKPGAQKSVAKKSAPAKPAARKPAPPKAGPKSHAHRRRPS
jgi:23S rRNA pseudouridine2605 synthase